MTEKTNSRFEHYSRYRYDKAEAEFKDKKFDYMEESSHVHSFSWCGRFSRAYPEALLRARAAKRAYEQGRKRLKALYTEGSDEAYALNVQYDALLKAYAAGDTSVLPSLKQFEVEKLGMKPLNGNREAATLRIGETRFQIERAEGDSQEIKHILHNRLDDLTLLLDYLQEINGKLMLGEKDIKDMKDILLSLDGEQVDGLYKTTIERIQSETNYFKAAKELQIYQQLLENTFPDLVRGAIMEFESDPNKMAHRGFYQPFKTQVYIGTEKPLKEFILYRLSLSGLMPESIQIIEHEMVHAEQDLYANDLVWDRVFRRLNNDYMHPHFREKSISEAQAYRVGSLSDGRRESDAFVNRVSASIHYKSHAKGLGKVLLIKAIDSIDSLNALGLPQNEIAQLVANENERRLSREEKEDVAKAYPLLQERILLECNRLGLDNEDLRDLVTIHFLEKEIAISRAQGITVQEIHKMRTQSGKQ